MVQLLDSRDDVLIDDQFELMWHLPDAEVWESLQHAKIKWTNKNLKSFQVLKFVNFQKYTKFVTWALSDYGSIWQVPCVAQSV